VKRPLLITDCDEVLVHMIAPLSQWLSEERDIHLPIDDHHGYEYPFTRRSDGSAVPKEQIWPLVADFFTGEMHRQTLAPHADAALATIAEVADVVVLTNLMDTYHAERVAQLDAFGIRHRVVCNQGDKGAPVANLIAEYDPSVAVFVDDMDNHHASVATFAPDVWRLHMIVEPRVAKKRPPAPAAHARIDDWHEALPWIMARFAEAA
jgi:hypothetical protein